MAKDTATTPDRVSILVCADGPVVFSWTEKVVGSIWTQKHPGLNEQGTCQTDSDGNSTVKATTLEDLFRSHPPPIFTQIKEGIERIESKIGNRDEGRVGALRTRIDELRENPAPLRDYSFDSIVHALCMGFAIVLSFYALGAIGSAILRALRLMD